MAQDQFGNYQANVPQTPYACDPSGLSTAAQSFIQCISSSSDMEAVKTYLLAQIAGGSTDPTVLKNAALAAGFGALNNPEQLQVQNYLLKQIAGV